MGRGARPLARACVAQVRDAVRRLARRLSCRLPGEARVADDRRGWRQSCRDRGRGGVRGSSAYDARGDAADRDVAAAVAGSGGLSRLWGRSEEHTSELQSLMRISSSVFFLKKKKTE